MVAVADDELDATVAAVAAEESVVADDAADEDDVVDSAVIVAEDEPELEVLPTVVEKHGMMPLPFSFLSAVE